MEKIMSGEAEDIEIMLEEPKNETSDEIKVEIAEEKEPEGAKSKDAAEISPQEGINELKRRLAEEQNARIEAERRMQAAYQQAQRARGDVTEAQYHQVVSAIEAVEGRGKALEAAYAEASSVGDYDKLAQINRAMVVNQDQMEKLRAGEKAIRQQIEAERANPNAQPVQQMPPPPRVDDVIEDMASKVTPRSAAWLRSVKDHLKDERAIRKMFNAHEAAIIDGVVPDSDEYFEFIEQRLGMRKVAPAAPPAAEEEVSALSSAAAPAPARKPSPPPAAPVSRGSGRPGTVRLSAAEAQTARDLGMSPEEYARNKQALIKEGRYGH
jgi:hypothetical protein